MGTVRYTVIDGEIIAEKRNGVCKQYVPDSLGSTVALLDNTQTQTDTFTYWPYGEVAGRTGTTPTPFQFVGTAGYRQDSATKTYVRARVLDTPKGRWLTEDPIGFSGGDWNFYRYVENNPSSSSDPTGLRPRMTGCTAAEKKRINKQIQDVCNQRIQMLPSAHLRKCLKKRCGNLKIICRKITQYPCRPNDAGETIVDSNSQQQFTDTIYLCSPNAFNRAEWGCLGKIILHEMIHTCNDLDCPASDNNATLPGQIPAGPGSVQGMAQIPYSPRTPPCPR